MAVTVIVTYKCYANSQNFKDPSFDMAEWIKTNTVQFDATFLSGHELNHLTS